MATLTKTQPRNKPNQGVPAKLMLAPRIDAPPVTAIATKVETLYLITGEGLEILIGAEGDRVRRKIKEDKSNNPLAYRHYDDDKRVWATWAVLQPDDTVKPLSFPDPSEYGMTPPELYTKAATFKVEISKIAQILGETKETIWDKMMKPTTVITAIVAIIAVVGIVIIAAGG